MKKTTLIPLAIAFSLVIGFAAAAPDQAEASCYGKCVYDNGCFRCETAQEPTGALCSEPSPCRCIFEQCPFTLQSSADSFTTVGDAEAAGLFVAPEPAAQTPNVDGSCTPEEMLFGLPTAG